MLTLTSSRVKTKSIFSNIAQNMALTFGENNRCQRNESYRWQCQKIQKTQENESQKLSNKLELSGVYVCRGFISRIEDKTRTVTDIELFAIAEALNVEIKDLYNKKQPD